MTRNYNTPRVSADWAADRWTDMAVAVAIHAIADNSRTPHAIWEEPTPAEWDHVKMAVDEYVRHGDFPKYVDGLYSWGQTVIAIPTF